MLQQLKNAAIRAAMSRDWIVRQMGKARAADVEAGLDHQVAAILEYQRRAKLPPLESLTPVKARRFAESNIAAADLPNESMAHVTDTTVGDQRTPVRIYVPHNAGKDWLVWFHGGGGVIGSIAGSDNVCRYLAAKTGHTIASVGYRLGPEDRHPAGLDDACSAWEALVERAPAGGRVLVGGDSFGGYLAAHVDHWTRAAGVRTPDVQILIYPIVDMRLVSPSLDRFSEGFLLTRTMIEYFQLHYINPGEDLAAISPWFFEDVAGSAPALVVTAGFDPLVEEGDAWAERLREAKVPVHHRRYDSLIHGFLSLGGIVRAARVAIDDICQEIVDSSSW